ncbi:hypothetical protein IWX84_002828 [Flavobacterium sp. CG_9.10]|nr:hypothetical protein [Flavobacterium sp. CG_9.10]
MKSLINSLCLTHLLFKKLYDIRITLTVILFIKKLDSITILCI